MRVLPIVTAGLLGLGALGTAAWAKPQEPLPASLPDVPVVSCSDYLGARFAAAHHDLPAAARLFDSCLRRTPDNGQLLASAFFYAAASGNIDDSARLAKKLVAVQPTQRMAHLVLASVALKDQDYSRARAEIGSANKDILAAYGVQLLDAWAMAGDGQGAAAEKLLQALHKQIGADAAAGFNEALLADYLGNPEKAAAIYRKTLQTAGPSPRLVDAYGRFLERSGQHKEAEQLYQTVKADPSAQPVALAGLARLAAGVKPKALVSSPQEGAAEALLGIASLLSDDANADVSILFLHLTLYLRPDFELAQLLMADRLETVENYEAAIAVYDEVKPTSAYYRLAGVQSASDKVLLKKPDEALKQIRALSALYPNDLDIWISYGDLLRQMEHNDEAVKVYGKAIALLGKPDKKQWMLYYARATAAQSAGNWAEAEADLKQALQLNPEEPQILNFLGYSWVDRHENLTQAMAMLEKANKLAPDNGYITDSVGWAYFRLGRFGDATSKLELAVQQEPGDATINDHLGDAYWKMGRKLEAGFQWNHALAFGPDATEKNKILTKLKDVPASE
ncbi:MAG: tetratricopeptide repeat protein [Rhizomicrobium sp.]